MSEMVCKLTICHFEDEPIKVYYPSLLDIAIGDWLGASSVELVSSDAEDLHVLSFSVGDRRVELSYRIHDGRIFNTPSDDELRASILHVVDWSVAEEKDAGLKFYHRLKELNVSPDAIWLITGYANTARTQLGSEAEKLRIVPKPAPHDKLTSDMLSIVKSHLEASGIKR